MSAEYATNGLIGVLTPQANTTVEPEMWSLLPAGWSILNARLTSACDTMESRLVDYADNLSATSAQFANAPLSALAFACTGASYLMGHDKEQRIIDEVETRYNIPCVTAAQATATALKTMGAKKLALLSPYPDSLNTVSAQYWVSQGFSIVEKKGPAMINDAFHPIYAMSTEAVFQSYLQLAKSDADAVLMLGTGMPTLASLVRGHQQQLTPAISCNLALAWATVHASDNVDISLDDWLEGKHWLKRFRLIAGGS